MIDHFDITEISRMYLSKLWLHGAAEFWRFPLWSGNKEAAESSFNPSTSPRHCSACAGHDI